MTHYELTYIVPMNYTIDEVPVITKKVNDLLKANGASIAKEESMGKLKFAYPIEKLSHGYYQVVEFDMDPANTQEIERNLRIMNEVLRHIMIKKKIKSEEELAAELRLREKLAKQAAERKSIFDEDTDTESEPVKRAPRAKSPKAKTAVTSEEKVSIEDLDKKLESILEGEDMIK